MPSAPHEVFLASLDKTQYEPPESFRVYQRRLIERMVRHARAETEFYPDHLAPIFRADDSIDWDRWTEIPILTRKDAQEAGDALFARTLPPQAGKVVAATTSGSTGRHFRHRKCELQQFAAACANERILAWHQLQPSALDAAIRHVEDDSTPPSWPDGQILTGWRIGHPESTQAVLDIATPVDKQLEWLRRVRPATLVTYPTNLRELGRTMRRDSMDKLHLAALLTTGEMLSEESRNEIEADFGLRPIDRYGAAEIGVMAGHCPVSGLHHVAAELVLVEIIDEDDQPLANGKAGRLVATSFYNFATPLIRYDMGDYAQMSESDCPCGRTLPLIDRILGRSRNMFHLADGSRVWPVLDSKDVARFLPHRQFQVVQEELNLIRYIYVPESKDQVIDLDGLRAFVKDKLHPAMEIEPQAVDHIARSQGGKFEDYVSLLD